MQEAGTQGFTLIELLIVIAIVGILAAIMLPNLLSTQRRAYDTAASACAHEVAKKQAMFLIDTGKYAGQAELSGLYDPACPRGVTWTVSNVSQVTYTVTAAHTSGSKSYTVTEQGDMQVQ